MALGNVGSMAVALLGDMKDFDKKMDGATKKVSTFDKTVGKMGKAVTKAAKAAALAAAAAVTAFGVSAVKTFVEFDTGMREVFTLMPELSAEAREAMEEDVKALSEQIAVLPEEVIPALYQAISAGVPQDTVFSFLEIAGKAAIGGVTDLATAVDGLTTVTNAYGSEVISVEEAADIMFTTVKEGKTTFEELSARLFQAVPVAAAVGIEFSNVAAAAAQITLSGVPMRVAMTQIRSLINEVAFEGKELNKVFQEAAGMSFPAFIESGGDIADLIGILEGAAADAGISIAELTANLEAQGALLNLSGVNLDNLNGILLEMADNAGANQEAYEEMAAGVQYEINQLKVWWQNLKLDIGGDLTENLQDLLGWLEENREAIGDGIKAVFDGIIDGMEWLSENGGIVKAALITVAAGFTILWAAANPVAAAIVAIVAALAYFESKGGVAAVYDGIQNVAQEFRDLVVEEKEVIAVTQAMIDSITDTMVKAGGALQDYLDESGKDVETIGKVWQTIVSYQEKAIEDLADGVRFDVVLDNFSMMVTGILDEYGIMGDDIAVILLQILGDSADMWSQATGVAVGSVQQTSSAVRTSSRVIVEALEVEKDAMGETAKFIATSIDDIKAAYVEQREAIGQLTAAEDAALDASMAANATRLADIEAANEAIASSYASMWEGIKNEAATALVDMVQGFIDFSDTRETEEETHQANLQAIRDEYAEGSQTALETALGIAESEYKAHRTTIAGTLRDMFGDFISFLADELWAMAAAETVKSIAAFLSLNPVVGSASALAAGQYAVGAAGVSILASSIPGYAEGGLIPGPVGAPQIIMAHGGEDVATPEQQAERGIDYERMGEAVAAGNVDAMMEMGGTSSGSSSSADLRTKLAQLLYDPLQVEAERRGGAA